MFNTAQRKPRLIAWLLTAMLLWVGAAAAAHELDHALDNHQEPCALHHYAGHHGGLPAANTHPPAPPAEARLDLSCSRQFFSELRPAPYAVRAPPSV
jgi:hypothetical protein